MDDGVRGRPGALAVQTVNTPREGPAPTHLHPTEVATARARTPPSPTVQDLFVLVSYRRTIYFFSSILHCYGLL